MLTRGLPCDDGCDKLFVAYAFIIGCGKPAIGRTLILPTGATDKIVLVLVLDRPTPVEFGP